MAQLLGPGRAVAEMMAADVIGKVRQGRERRPRRHPERDEVIARIRQAIAEDHHPVERFGEPCRHRDEQHDTERDRKDDGRTAVCHGYCHGDLLWGPSVPKRAVAWEVFASMPP